MSARLFLSLLLTVLAVAPAGAAPRSEDRLRADLARAIEADGMEANQAAAEALAAIGDRQFASGRTDAARVSYRNALWLGAGTAFEQGERALRVSLRLARLLNLSDDVDQAKRIALEVQGSSVASDALKAAATGVYGLAAARSRLMPVADVALSEALAVERPDADSPDRADLLATRGVVRTRQGRPKEALEDFRAAYALDRRRFGEVDSRTLASADLLSQAYIGAYDYRAAEPLLVVALAAARAVQESDGLATALNNLAVLRLSQGRPDLAEPLLRETYANRLASLGEAGADTRLALANLALCIAEQHRMAEAERLLRRVLALDLEDPYGATTAAATQVQLATVLFAQRRFADAEPLLRAALAVQEEWFDAEAVPLTENNLAFALVEQGRFAEAEAMARSALEAATRSEAGPLVRFKAQKNLGRALAGQGRFDEGRDLLLAVQRVQVAELGAQHPDTILSAGHLGVLELDQAHRPAAALYWYRVAGDGILQRVRGSRSQEWELAELRERTPIFYGTVRSAWQLAHRTDATP